MNGRADARPGAGAEAGLGDFGAAIVHGIRTPLHSMLGFLELLALTELDDEQQRLVDSAMTGAEGLVGVSERLFFLLRLALVDQLGGLVLRPEDLELADLVGLVVAEPGIAARGTVTTRISPDVPQRIAADRQCLRQLLVELVDNAGRHGGRSQVTLAVELAGPVTPGGVPLRIVVTDAGPGLPGGLAHALLDPTLPFEESPGLGLLLVRHLAEALGAKVHAVVGSPDGRRARGTAVTVSLTVATAAPEVPSPRQPAPRGSGSPREPRRDTAPRPLRVLLAEDNAVNRLLAQRQLAKLGHELDVTTTGAAVVEAAARGGYDVILMDRHMPDVDGLEATRRIRAAEPGRAGPGRRVPIIAVTADATPGQREECLAAGMDDFLSKPVDLVALDETLRRFCPSPAGAEQADVRALDATVLQALAAGLGKPAAAELVRTYLTELPGRRLLIQSAIRRSSAQQVLPAAASLRASSEALGALELARVCRAVEEAAHAGRPADARAALPDLLARSHETQAALLAYREPGAFDELARQVAGQR